MTIPLVQASIADVVERFPGLRTALVVADGRAIAESRPQALTAEIAAIEAETKRRFEGPPMRDVAGMQA